MKRTCLAPLVVAIAVSPTATVAASPAATLAASPATAEDGVAELQRMLDRSVAYDAVENISNAFGNWIDDQQWPSMSELFAEDGWRQKYLVGFYVGPERIRTAEQTQAPRPPGPRRSIRIHLRMQPVIDVTEDGGYAYLRTRLLHMTGNRDQPGEVKNGMYPNDAAALEGGVWKLSIVGIDEPYFVSNGWANGWARVPPISEERRRTVPPAMRQLADLFPPDIPLAAMPVRQGAFTIGEDFVHFPEVKPMWFHYPNPVSGRLPENYCPDLRTCEPGFQPRAQ